MATQNVQVIDPEGRIGTIPRRNLENARAAGYRIVGEESPGTAPGTIEVLSPDGTRGTIPRDKIEQAKAAGYEILGQEVPAGGGGLGSALLAGLAGFGRGATFSLSDVLLTKFGVEPETLQRLEQDYPTASGAWEMGGVLSSFLLPGVGVAGGAAKAALGGARAATALPRAAAKVGEVAGKGIAAAIPTGTKAGQLAAKAAPVLGAGAVESQLYGTGQLLSEDLIGEKEVTAERYLSALGMDALLGAGGAGVIGAASPLLKKAGEAALSTFGPAKKGITLKEWLKGYAERKAEKTVTHKVGRTKRIREQEKRVGKTVTGQTEGAAGRYLLDNKLVSATDNSAEAIQANITNKRAEVGDQYSALLGEIDDALEKEGRKTIIDFEDVKGEVYKKMLKPLEGNAAMKNKRRAIEDELMNIEAEALKQLGETAEEQAAAIAAGNKPGFNLRLAMANRKGYQDKGDYDALKTNEARQAYREISAIFNRKIDEAVDTLIETRKGKGAIKEVMKQGPEELKKVRRELALLYELEKHALDNVEQLRSNRQISPSDYGFGTGAGVAGTIGSTATGGVMPALAGVAKGLVGAILHNQARRRGSAVAADVANKLSKMEAQASKTANATHKAAKGLIATLKAGKKLTPKVASMAGVELSLKDAPYKDRKKADPVAQIREIYSNPEKFAQVLGKNIQPIFEVAPKVAEQMQVRAVQAMGFLYDKAPKPPNYTGLKATKEIEDWRPSDSEAAKFNRYVRAVYKPVEALERISKGNVLNEDVEALKVVYPRIYADFTDQLLEALPEYQDKLNSSQLSALSRLLGQPMGISQSPEFGRIMQQAFHSATIPEDRKGQQTNVPRRVPKTPAQQQSNTARIATRNNK